MLSKNIVVYATHYQVTPVENTIMSYIAHFKYSF